MKTNWKTKILNKHERYFFDIPVFRCEKSSWNTEINEKKQALAQNIAGEGKKITEKEMAYSEAWLRPTWTAYRYSEMVGMIRLFAINGQIRGELWFIKERVSKNLKKKTWQYIGKIFEYWVHQNESNEEIFNFIGNKLTQENKDGLLKKRYIDLESFGCAGKYIDYLELSNFLS